MVFPPELDLNPPSWFLSSPRSSPPSLPHSSKPPLARPSTLVLRKDSQPSLASPVKDADEENTATLHAVVETRGMRCKCYALQLVGQNKRRLKVRLQSGRKRGGGRPWCHPPRSLASHSVCLPPSLMSDRSCAINISPVQVIRNNHNSE